MRFSNATNLNRKSGGAWGRWWPTLAWVARDGPSQHNSNQPGFLCMLSKPCAWLNWRDPLLFVATSSELLTVNTALNHS